MENFETPTTVDLVIKSRKVLLDSLEMSGVILGRYNLIGEITIIYIEEANLPYVMNHLGANTVGVYPTANGLLDEKSNEAAGIEQLHSQPYMDLTGRGTLLGFVDTGIDYTKPAFRYEDGSTKIKYIWDQTVEGAPPPELHFGTEFDEEAVSSALGSDDPYAVVSHRDNVGHGTFLASVAGGRESGEYMGAAPDAGIIAVKLRKCRGFYLEEFLVPAKQNEVYESSDIMLAIEYIIGRARSLKMPVSICIGLGSNLGGHDGFQHLEEYLSAISNRTAVCLCVSGGNESQARHHTQGKIPSQGSSQDVEIKVPENPESFLFQMWNQGTDRLSISLHSPTGESTGRFPPKSGTRVDSTFVFERAQVIVKFFYPVGGSGAQLAYVKILDPTPGIWTLSVTGDIVLDGTYHIWMPITGQVTPGIEFLKPAPEVTVVVPGTAIGVITCGAYDATTKSLLAESSWGPTRLPVPKPDFCAPGGNVKGTYPGGHGTMSGTSVAAAVTAGAGALMLQWGVVDGNDIALNTYRIRALMISGCIRDVHIKYPNPQWGYGTLNLYNTFDILRSN